MKGMRIVSLSTFTLRRQTSNKKVLNEKPLERKKKEFDEGIRGERKLERDG